MKYIYLKENSEPFTESAATSLDAGSRGWDCERMMEARQFGLLTKVTSASDPARNPAPISTSGIGTRPANNSTGWATHEQTSDFTVRSTSNIGQEVLDANGKVVVWTTDVVLAHRIARMLNADQG